MELLLFRSVPRCAAKDFTISRVHGFALTTVVPRRTHFRIVLQTYFGTTTSTSSSQLIHHHGIKQQ
jgi:hypothetical protein